ncbi:ovoinhibitor-like [Ostrea edulis]|uniref:ovoinhibitor-like n=1 Tax=Ostrea edulis TaxID=37623 RepID=UPI0024AF0CE1|nr:ovoinhibitor-like [Ostrea edulis]
MYLRSFWYQFIEMFLCQIIALASIAFSVETKSTGCACPYSLLPVCGKDGVTYDNECAMKCVGISKLNDGECVEQPCVCPLNIDPICGKDGKTYDNECLMNCASVKKKKKGPCKTKVLTSEEDTPVLSSADETVCLCNRLYLPVCGTDGVTYNNECLMNCEGISKLNDGECVEQPCGCQLNIDPICGKDGKTYDNECLMNCASVSKKKKGPCKTEVLISEDETPVLSSADEPVCMCTFIYFPVCGADGVTYNNECLMTCHNVKMGYEGTCKS